jgi:Inorganic H+ pyrophosphatase
MAFHYCIFHILVSVNFDISSLLQPCAGCCRLMSHWCSHQCYLWSCSRLQIHQYPNHCYCHEHLCQLQLCSNVWYCSCCPRYAQYNCQLQLCSNVIIAIAIDAYGPISDSTGGIAEMAGMNHRIIERTDAVDAAVNTTAAISKVLLIKFYFNCFMLSL